MAEGGSGVLPAGPAIVGTSAADHITDVTIENGVVVALNPEKTGKDSMQYAYVTKWTELIGPAYGAVIRPLRRLISVGAVGLMVGLFAGIFWMSRVDSTSPTAGILGAVAFFVPGFAILGVGLALQTRLAWKINRDLWAVGVLPAKYAPDLRNPSRFLFWCRHSGVTPEKVQEAGRQAAALRSRDVPSDQGLWDLAAKQEKDEGDGGSESMTTQM